MDLEAKMLTTEEFASLLLVGSRLRMTTPGRVRIYAGQLAS
jgi:hypothetical protein